MARPQSQADPGRSLWTRLDGDVDVVTTDDNARLEERVGAVQHALEEAGSMTRAELAERVGAAAWDPTAWARVLRVGVREERIVYRRGRYHRDYDTAEHPPRDRVQH